MKGKTMENNALFPLGTIVITPGVRKLIGDDAEAPSRIFAYIRRHARGDWGEEGGFDAQINKENIKKKQPLFSCYYVNQRTLEKIYIITEGNRKKTTILTPEEY